MSDAAGGFSSEVDNPDAVATFGAGLTVTSEDNLHATPGTGPPSPTAARLDPTPSRSPGNSDTGNAGTLSTDAIPRFILHRPQPASAIPRSFRLTLLATLPTAPAAASVGYLLMGGLFVFGGIDHALRFGAVRAMLAKRGWPMPTFFLAAASVLEFVAGLGLVLGIARPWSALALAAFTVVASVLLLDFWRFSGPEREGMRSGFLVNVGLLGGLLLAFAVTL